MGEVAATKVGSYEELEASQERGAFWIAQLDEEVFGLWYRCPKDNHLCYIPFRKEPEQHPSWVWDGNRDTPTLTPSILDRGCGYHGYLTNGIWKEC